MPRGHWVSGFVSVPASESVIALGEKQLRRPIGVQEGKDDDGRPYLRVVFLAPEIPPRIQVLDCTSWLGRPELARSFTQALFHWGRAKHPSTRRLTTYALGVFFAFLDDRGRPQPSRSVVRISELHVDVLNAYVDWLNDRRRRDGEPLGRPSKNQLFLGLTKIVHTLRGMKEYAGQIDRELCLNRGPWANAGRYSRPRSSLDNDALARIESACIAEIDKTMTLAEDAERLIKENAHRVPKDLKTPGAYNDLGICLATIATEFAGVVPNLKDLYQTSRSLGFAIQRLHGGNAAVRERLFPSPRQLVPFVVLLAARTFFSPDTVLGLRWKQITPRNWFYGDERWDIDPARPESD
jgi:hypothetical protein